jgi:hypothetical protein
MLLCPLGTHLGLHEVRDFDIIGGNPYDALRTQETSSVDKSVKPIGTAIEGSGVRISNANVPLWWYEER